MDEHQIKIKLSEIDERFTKLKTKVLRANLTKNKRKLAKYRDETVDIYNSFVTLASPIFDKATTNLQLLLKGHFIKYRDILLQFLGALQIVFTAPSDLHNKLMLVIDELPSSDSEIEAETTITVNMASNMEFISLCAKQISKNFDGNYTSLQAFINSIKFLQQLATTDELRNLLKSFILTKLDQRALEKIPSEPASIDIIISGLTTKIKPDSSKIIEGRMVALTADQKNMRDFQKQAEKLAEEYQRALVIEGLPLSLAEEKTIEKTVELCRKNTKSAEVKAVLSSTAHSSPAAVVAKMIIQLDLVNQDRLLANAERAENSNKEKKPHDNRGRYGNQNNRQSNDGPNGQNGNRNDANQRNNGQRNGYNNNNGQNGQSNQDGHHSRNNNYHNNYHNNGNQNNSGRNGNGNGNRNFYANNNTSGTVFSVQGNASTPLQSQGAQQHQDQEYQHM